MTAITIDYQGEAVVIPVRSRLTPQELHAKSLI